MISTSRTQLTVHLTDRAQERILDLRNSPHQVAKIRLYVQGGGCSGFQYQIEIAQEDNEDDFVIEIGRWIKLLVDPMSAPYLDNTTIDYADEAFSNRFIFNNPHAKNTCGCGSSFSVE